MTLRFKTETEYARWAAAARVRVVARDGETVLADTAAGEAAARAPARRMPRLPGREQVRAAAAWGCLAVAYAGLVGMWTCEAALWLVHTGVACELM